MEIVIIALIGIGALATVIGILVALATPFLSPVLDRRAFRKRAARLQRAGALSQRR